MNTVALTWIWLTLRIEATRQGELERLVRLCNVQDGKCDTTESCRQIVLERDLVVFDQMP